MEQRFSHPSRQGMENPGKIRENTHRISFGDEAQRPALLIDRYEVQPQVDPMRIVDRNRRESQFCSPYFSQLS